MIHTSSVTSVSWIPSEAVEGISKPLFEVGVTHYDEPAARPSRWTSSRLRATDRFRFANRLSAWIEVVDGRIVDAGYGDESGGVMGATTVRLGLGDATFAAVGLRRPANGLNRCRQSVPPPASCKLPAGGRRYPAPRHIKRPPFFRLQAPVVWTTLALTLRGRRIGPRSRCRGASPFPSALGLRRRPRAGGQGRRGRLPGVVSRRAGASHPLGRRGHAGPGHGGRDRTRTGAVGPDHAIWRQTCDPRAEAGGHPHRTGRRRGASFICCSTVCWRSRSTARWWPRSGRARSWANGPRSRVVDAARRSGR